MFLAFKELKFSKLKYAMVGFILTAILFLLFFINGLASGLATADSSSLKNLPADYVVMNSEADGNILKSEVGKNAQEELEDSVAKDQFTPLTITMSTVKGENAVADVVYFALETDHPSLPPVIEGKPIEEITGEEVVVDKSLKRQGYALHDTLHDENLGVEFTIAGFLENHTYSHMPVVYTSLNDWNKQPFSNPDKNQALLYYGKETDVAKMDVLTLEKTVESMPGYSETQGSLMMMVTFLFIISAFVSTVFFYVITIQKRNQFGVLKAIGASTAFIAKGLVLQVVFLTISGLVLSLLGVSGMTKLLPEEMPFEISWHMIGFTGIVFLALNVSGSLVSVHQVAKTDPLEAIGRAD